MVARHQRAPLVSDARTISALNHAHICGLFDIGRQDATDFLMMEYLEGERLAARLARAFETATVTRFDQPASTEFRQFLDAVNAAGAALDVHRIVDNT